MLKRFKKTLKAWFIWADWEDNVTVYGCLLALAFVALLALPNLWGGNA